VLFGSLFAVQASLVALSPIISEVAADLHVSIAVVGQLRTVSGLAAVAVAVVLLAVRWRWDLRAMLATGLGLLAVGALASALAPTLAALAAAQAVLGAGVALALTAGLTATAEWVPENQRGRALSWALIGQPAAWIVGLPVVGLLGEPSWRLAWLVPAGVAVATAVAVVRRPGEHRSLGAARSPWSRGVVTWAVAELLAYAGWTGVLIYAGALFTRLYEVSIGTVGLLLGVGAVAYLPGNFLARRWVDRAAFPLSVVLAGVMAAAVLVFTTTHPSLVISVALFAVVAFLGGARTIAGSALGLHLGGSDRLRAMSLRTASVQLGYTVGASAGGVGLTVAGWTGLGVVLAAMLLLAAAVLLQRMLPVRDTASA
jgi:predicted MFS family arabinose efflux permease